MHRLLPSHVVAAIEKTYPWTAITLDVQHAEQILQPEHLTTLAPLVGMIEAVAPDHIALNADELAKYVYAVAALRSTVTSWQQVAGGKGRVLEPLAVLSGHTPITTVLELLRKCPDEVPTSATSGLEFVADRALRESLRLDLSNAFRAYANGDYKAATVLAGSCAEALLLDAILAVSDDDRAKAVTALSETHPTTQKQPERWYLLDYVAVSAKLALIDDAVATNVKLASDYRNLIHPGRALRLKKRASQATALTALAAVQAIVEALGVLNSRGDGGQNVRGLG